jgi:hypothetical protein
MHPHDRNELTDQELDALLPAWKTQRAPARLRTSLFGAVETTWWRMSIRVPVPVAALLLVLFAVAAWRWMKPVTGGSSELQPVTELRPRIIRSASVQN